MSTTSLTKLGNILFKNKYSMGHQNNETKTKNVQIKYDLVKEKFLEKTRYGKFEDADVEDNTISEDEIDTPDYSISNKHHKSGIIDDEEYLSEVFMTTRSNSPLVHEQRYILEGPQGKINLPTDTFNIANGYPVSNEAKYIRSKSVAASPELMKNTFKNRRQSAPVTLERHNYLKEKIVDQMEKEQERVVLKLIKQIHQLKSENQQLKKELQMSQSHKTSTNVKKNNSISSASSRDSTYQHQRSLSNASTVYNPRQNSVASTSIRDTVLTDFDSLK
ncbi:hypothetical protein QEN19_001682 [Hanseniaspora menglaensis]